MASLTTLAKLAAGGAASAVAGVGAYAQFDEGEAIDA